MKKIGILTLATPLLDGRCRAAEDGAACAAEAWMRGFCARHYLAAQARKLLDRLGLPPTPMKHDIRLKAPDQLQPGLCRLVVNGQPCPLPATRRGLCIRHYASIWQRPDLRLDDFALPPFAPMAAGDFDLKKRIVPSCCRILERGVACHDTPHARGLCKRHYAWLREHEPDLFERLAEREPGTIVYTLRIRLKPGRCRVNEDGHPCNETAYSRGLCVRHYSVLFDRRELFNQIAAPSKAKVAAVLKCQPIPVPGTCHLLENGVACTAPSEHRGVCMRHYRMLHSKQYRLADFLLPKPEPVYALKPLTQRHPDICRVIENEEPCQDTAYQRGVCRRHQRVFQRAGRLDEFGVAPGPTGEPNRRVPHAYLDKNILFDWCDAEAFGGVGQQASWELVERVRNGNMVATISASAVTSSYNHVRHRATRTPAEGGGGLEENAGEALARKTLSRMLAGTWRILALTPHDLRTVLAAATAAQSYEDALEWAAYQQARRGHHGPRWFITRDGDFPEGVPPWTVAEYLREVERR